jgi:hypothetical protein
VPDRIVFEHVLEALVFGAGYERIASPGCSDRTIRRRLREWADHGVVVALFEATLERLALDMIAGAVAGIDEESTGVLWGNQRHGFGGGAENLVEGARGPLPEQVFKLGVGLFDRIEVGGIAPQRKQLTANGLNGRFGVGTLVHGEIVENNYLAWAQRWHEKLIDKRISPI